MAEFAVLVKTVCSRSMTTQKKVDFCFQVTLQLDYVTLQELIHFCASQQQWRCKYCIGIAKPVILSTEQ